MAQQILRNLLKQIDNSINTFLDTLPSEQKRIFDEIVALTKQLDIKNGNIQATLKNTKLVNVISAKLDNIILSESYLKNVADFANIYDKVTKLNNEYLAQTFDTFKPTKVLEEIKKANIKTTVEQLTETGVGRGMNARITNVLQANINGGGQYADLIQVLQGELIDGKGKYMYGEAQKIVIDAVHQYNAQYIKSVTNDLGLEWFQYLGSLLTTSREFCKRMVEKRYFHISEVPMLLDGIIDGKQIPLGKNGLPLGMFDNENESNFLIYRGGHKCGHQIFPVSSASVPSDLVAKFS